MSLPSSKKNRLEALLAYLSGQKVDVPAKPRNRLEHYLLYLCKLSESFPASPRNRLEYYLDHLCEHRGSGGGDITLETLNVSENGTTNAPSGKAYNKVVTNVQPTGTKQVSISQNGTTTENVADYASAEITVTVPNSYAAGDEGKVVSSGALVSQTAHAQVTQNGTIDTTLNNSVEVAVPVPTLDSLNATDNGTYTPQSGHAYDEVVVNVPKGITPSGTLPITDNGTYDVTQYASAEVNVQSGGGGAQEYSGVVELVNVKTSELVIPVDLSEAEAYEIVVYADRTGTIVNGEVVYDDVPTVPSEYTSGNDSFVWYLETTEPREARTMLRDGSNNTTITRPYNCAYCYIYRGNNGGQVGLTNYNPVSGSEIKLNTGNINRRYCKEGLYVRFSYHIIAE